ncbi:MAG: tetratricopeptide repeat protein [Candidatus Omnitrophica bacterium]|nr:tetratricopeptide repeat protein [Candidatus Omnitrophota bacterium]
MPRPAAGRAARGPLVGILSAAFVLRIAYWFFSQKSPFYEPLLLDPAYYEGWAARILRGDFVGEGVFYGLPLYPFFLAALYKLSSHALAAVKAAQIFLGLLNIFFIYKIGKKMADEKTGLVAASLAAFYGPFFFHEGILIPETLGLFLYTVSFYGVCLFLERPTAKGGAWLGLAFGLAALTKAGILFFVSGFLIYFFIRFLKTKKSVRPAAACALTFLLVLAPVAAHNRIYGKDTVLLTAHSGFNFYIGNNPDAEGVFKAPPGTGTNVDSQREDSRALAEKALGRTLKPSEVSKYWSDKARDWIAENPGAFLKLASRKLVLFFDAREISDVDDYAFGAKFNPLLKFPWPNFAWLGPFFLLGIFLSRGAAVRHRWAAVFWIAGYTAGVLMFFVNARYRLPILGVFFPFAALGILKFYESIRENRWGGVLARGAVLAGGILVTQANLVGTDWARDYVNAGDIFVKKEDLEQAVEFYREALKAEPHSAVANQAMGVALTKMGRSEEARDYYEKTIAEDPLDGLAYNNLGLWHDNHGDSETAEKYFLKAIELKPASYQAHNNLGMVYGKRGDNEKALAEFEASLKINPSNPRACTNLGLIYHRMGREADARAAWRRALAIDPDWKDARRALDLSESA